MEQILRSGYLEMGTEFPKRTMEAFVAFFVSLCISWVCVQGVEMSESGRAENKGNAEMTREENRMMYENESVMECRVDWISRYESPVFNCPVKEFGRNVSQPDIQVLSTNISENNTVKVQKITSASETMENRLETEEIVSGNTGSLNESEENIMPVFTYRLFGNGGMPEKTELSYDSGNISEEGWPVPRRDGKVFNGWYEDPACTVPYSGTVNGSEVTELYAGWKDFENFICDERGYITSCTGGAVTDGILVFPTDSACKGITGSAFEAVEDRITDIYIPDNILYIDEDAFSRLVNLMYIEVDPDNPNYYSKEGVLYSADGYRVAGPCWYIDVE